MRTVTLYELKKTTVIVGRGDTVLKYIMSPLPNRLAQVGEDSFVMPINDVELPVERIRRIEHGAMKNHFIALDTDLREILEAPFTSRIDQLNMALDAHIREKAVLTADNRLLRKRIDGFNRLPWWKRIFTRP